MDMAGDTAVTGFFAAAFDVQSDVGEMSTKISSVDDVHGPELPFSAATAPYADSLRSFR